MELGVIEAGIIDYVTMLRMQRTIFQLRHQEKVKDILLFVEHPSVFAMGKTCIYSNILVSEQVLEDNKIRVISVDREGELIYHGPGQIVGYLIMDLQSKGIDKTELIWKMEESFIRLLSDEFGIHAHRSANGLKGIWIQDKKLIDIVVSVKHWVTTHGFAFNVNTDLDYYKWIRSNDIADQGVISLKEILGYNVDIQELNTKIVKYICEIFKTEPVAIQKDDFMKMLR